MIAVESEESRRTRRQFRMMGFGIVGLILFGFFLIGAYGGYCWLTDTTEGEVEQLMEENVPLESSAREAFAFLDSRDIQHGPVEQVGSDISCCILEQEGYPASTNFIEAIFTDTGCDYPGCEDFQIDAYFILDAQHKVADYFAWETATCL